ncbi:MAG TPA: hypothetical protein VGN75_01610 [Kaistia sp.]|jgi:hypothetical protein|nr:hypothetical protein [Kaistia sp.]
MSGRDEMIERASRFPSRDTLSRDRVSTGTLPTVSRRRKKVVAGTGFTLPNRREK